MSESSIVITNENHQDSLATVERLMEEVKEHNDPAKIKELDTLAAAIEVYEEATYPITALLRSIGDGEDLPTLAPRKTGRRKRSTQPAFPPIKKD